MEKEIRSFSARFEVRRSARGPVIQGYAAVFNRLSEDLGGFREKIQPGAFRDALRTSDVRCLVNHDPSLIVGRTGVNLTLTEDRTGLHMVLTAPEKPSPRFDQLVSDVENGLISQQSFGFIMPENRSGERWETSDGATVRTLTRVQALTDCSPCTYPAYPDTSVAKRTLASLNNTQNRNGAQPPMKGHTPMNAQERLQMALRALDNLNETAGGPYWKAVGDLDAALENFGAPVTASRDGLAAVRAWANSPEPGASTYIPGVDYSNERTRVTAGEDHDRLYRPDKRGFGEYLRDIRRAMTPGGTRSEKLNAIEQRAAGTGLEAYGAPSDGGFAVQDEHVDMIGEFFRSNGIVSRCRVFHPEGNTLKIPMVDESSRVDGSRQGGVQAYWTSELGQLTSSAPKFQMLNMTLEKLTGLVFCSDEILEDYVTLGQFVSESLARELLFKVQAAVVAGSGAGQPLGIMNSGALVSITKETGQAADTIVTENVLKMFARFQPGNIPGGTCWLANRNTLPQLYTMTYDIGTGGEMAHLFKPGATADSIGSMLGYPVLFIEQCPTLGDLGDLLLVDLKQYFLLMKRGGPKVDMSVHLKFDYGQSAFRGVLRCEGQPALSAPITPYQGSDTVSPFIGIQAR